MVRQAQAESVAAAQEQSAQWRAQAQDALRSISELHKPLVNDLQQQPAPAAAQDGGSAAVDLQAALLEEQKKCAHLDAQVRVLCAQLLRMQASYQAAGRTLLPILGGVEAKLLSLQARSASRTK